MVDKAVASVAVASRVLYTSLPSTVLDLASADCKRGWTGLAGAASGSAEGPLSLRRWLGDEDMVVAVVAAVRGRSPPEFEAEDMAACDDGGNLPVNSSLRMRDLRSSSSSQTVDGALVERVDSVPSWRFLSGYSTRTRSVVSDELGRRLLRIVDSAGLG